MYQTKKDVVFSKDGKKLYYYPICRKGKSYQVPATVRLIEEYAFTKNRILQSIDTGKNTETISYYAFAYSKKLSKVILRGKIKNLNECSLAYCKNLKVVKNLEKIKYMHYDALHQTQIYLITADIRDLTYGNIGKI